MPKIIDHEKRKIQIAEATWRVILERGMEGATVRNIAKEADLSSGALRHYFSTQDELLMYAMNLVKENATARIEKIAQQNFPPKELVLKILMEIIPTNKETLAEMEVWFAFIAHFMHDKSVFEVHHDGILQGLQKLIELLEHFQLLKKELNKELEIEKLYALVDGLALHAMFEPNRIDKKKIEQVLFSHIQSICK
ncbi:TetR/AcrR family transcriptional regulator [Lederbergia lenta]|uniref:Putative transcriptional regulator n=1 Tax=Lederbergia lenta TaxID=1467 RepID=A0A2X4WTW9_LEDLE|nr:TetR/AcrR family transcriptional regulator [Lederbergia lenta]MEC2322873.1 TetR/AcrR family transcriptional regulator [Lederbergia lenta]SQI61942.1 putative transcriptional regulator [Lederbergia lenta]